MQIVIAGAGKYGRTLAGELVAEGHDITIIEKNEEWFEDIMEEIDLSGVVGNAASYLTQLEAGVDKCHAFLAMTGSDEINLIASIVAQSMEPKRPSPASSIPITARPTLPSDKILVSVP